MHDDTSHPCPCPCSDLVEEVRTRSVVVVDADGRERIRLSAEPDHARIRVSAVTTTGEPTCVDVFALDAEDADDRPYVGVELIERGTSVAGLTVSEGRAPRLWIAEPT